MTTVQYSLLARLPLCTVEPLQCAQNAAARLIFELSPSEHMTPNYCSYIGCPYAGASSLNYVALCMQLSPDAVQCIWGASCNQPHSRSGLRPSSADFSVPRTRTKFGERAFSYAGPSAWNTLPRHIRETVDSASFRKLLKTHYFTSAFGVV